jgi:hypothetical protein
MPSIDDLEKGLASHLCGKTSQGVTALVHAGRASTDCWNARRGARYRPSRQGDFALIQSVCGPDRYGMLAVFKRCPRGQGDPLRLPRIAQPVTR